MAQPTFNERQELEYKQSNVVCRRCEPLWLWEGRMLEDLNLEAAERFRVDAKLRIKG